jgi:hypothetical protein
MGNWAIVIRGVGCHHNVDLDADANKMAAEFVKQLKKAGHTVSHASFTYGGEDDLTPATAYLEQHTTPRCGFPINGEYCARAKNHEGDCMPPVKRL